MDGPRMDYQIFMAKRRVLQLPPGAEKEPQAFPVEGFDDEMERSYPLLPFLKDQLNGRRVIVGVIGRIFLAWKLLTEKKQPKTKLSEEKMDSIITNIAQKLNEALAKT
jgi:hypothetical protein